MGVLVRRLGIDGFLDDAALRSSTKVARAASMNPIESPKGFAWINSGDLEEF